MRDATRLWWGQITGPTSMVEATVHELRAGRCVVLALPKWVPWIERMRDGIREGMQGYGLLHHEAPADTDKPADILLDRFADEDIRIGYRANGGESVSDYLFRNRVLNEHVIWVKHIPATNSAWLELVRQYRKCSLENGLFILEVAEGMQTPRLPAHIRVLRYEDYISDYDMPLFCSHLVSYHNGTANWKMYMSTLAWTLCGRDARMATEFLSRLDDDDERDSEVVMLDAYRDCYGEPMSDADAKALSAKVWQAQIKVLYPLLEDHRIAFATRWQSQIEKALCEAGDHALVFGERVQNPLDAEWGLLYHMAHTYTSNSLRLLYIPSESDYYALEFYRDCRNCLAHRNRLRPSDVKRLLS